MTKPLAPAVAAWLQDALGRPLAVRLRFWDGSTAGPAGAPVCVVLRSPAAVRHLVWAPGQLGVARAFVSGDLTVEGDLETGLAAVLSAPDTKRRPTARQAAGGIKLLAGLGALGARPPVPAAEARTDGRLHSQRRDAQVISHHYDLSNPFYSRILDQSMAYSCAYWADEADQDLAAAQRAKLDLICRKLELRSGTRLLDLGCGWGSLTLHAAGQYGATVTAVTVSRQQHDYVEARVAEAGLQDLVDLRLCDYRDALAASPRCFDAVAAIEMGEHVGDANYPGFLRGISAGLRDEGRVLLQVMSRSQGRPGGGAFIERYIAPDMTMRPLHDTLRFMAAAGFEVRDVHALREHYAHTIRAWRAQLLRQRVEIEALIGEQQTRVWDLYLAGSALSFEANRMGVDQILAVRTSDPGRSGMAPTRQEWEPARADAGAPAG